MDNIIIIDNNIILFVSLFDLYIELTNDFINPFYNINFLHSGTTDNALKHLDKYPLNSS